MNRRDTLPFARNKKMRKNKIISFARTGFILCALVGVLPVNASGKERCATTKSDTTAIEPDTVKSIITLPLPNILVDKQIDSLIEYARKYTGTPYRRGGKGPNRFDCSGFMQYVFNHFSYTLNANSASQYLQGISVADEKIQRGDLVFFKGRNSQRSTVGHVGLVTEVCPNGEFRFIHASTSQGIRENWNYEPYYAQRFMGARRIYFASIDKSAILDAIIDLEDQDDSPFEEN